MAELSAVRGLEPGNGSPRTPCGLTSWGIHVAGHSFVCSSGINEHLPSARHFIYEAHQGAWLSTDKSLTLGMNWKQNLFPVITKKLKVILFR